MRVQKYYAVAIGLERGIYETWDETDNMVRGYPGAKHKSFYTRREAEEWLEKNPIPDPLAPEPLAPEPLKFCPHCGGIL